jgi:hypothetical protein
MSRRLIVRGALVLNNPSPEPPVEKYGSMERILNVGQSRLAIFQRR